MAKLKSELELTCPCCKSILTVDANLRRIIRFTEPPRDDIPDLDRAGQLLAEEQARRESMFEQSVQAERSRGDALSKRFEEALRQAQQEPITRPKREFDLD